MVQILAVVLLIVYLKVHWAWWIALALTIGFDGYMNIMPYLKLMREVEEMEEDVIHLQRFNDMTPQDVEPEIERWPH